MRARVVWLCLAASFTAVESYIAWTGSDVVTYTLSSLAGQEAAQNTSLRGAVASSLLPAVTAKCTGRMHSPAPHVTDIPAKAADFTKEACAGLHHVTPTILEQCLAGSFPQGRRSILFGSVHEGAPTEDYTCFATRTEATAWLQQRYKVVLVAEAMKRPSTTCNSTVIAEAEDWALCHTWAYNDTKFNLACHEHAKENSKNRIKLIAVKNEDGITWHSLCHEYDYECPNSCHQLASGDLVAY